MAGGAVALWRPVCPARRASACISEVLALLAAALTDRDFIPWPRPAGRA